MEFGYNASNPHPKETAMSATKYTYPALRSTLSPVHSVALSVGFAFIRGDWQTAILSTVQYLTEGRKP